MDLVFKAPEKQGGLFPCEDGELKLTPCPFLLSPLRLRPKSGERAFVSLQQNGLLIHYTEEEAIDCTVEVVEQGQAK